MSTFTSNQTLPFDSCIHTWDANEMMVDDHTGYSSDENLEQPDEPSFPFVDPTDDDESQYVFNTQSQQSQWFQPPSTFPQSGGFNDQVDIDKLTNRITELEVDPRKKTKRGQSGKGALTTNTTLANRTNTGRHGRKNSKRFEPTSPTSSTAIVHHRKKRQDSGSYSKNIDKAFEALTDVIMTDYPTDQSNTVVGENSQVLVRYSRKQATKTPEEYQTYNEMVQYTHQRMDEQFDNGSNYITGRVEELD